MSDGRKGISWATTSWLLTIPGYWLLITLASRIWQIELYQKWFANLKIMACSEIFFWCSPLYSPNFARIQFNLTVPAMCREHVKISQKWIQKRSKKQSKALKAWFSPRNRQGLSQGCCLLMFITNSGPPRPTCELRGWWLSTMAWRQRSTWDAYDVYDHPTIHMTQRTVMVRGLWAAFRLVGGRLGNSWCLLCC